MVNKIKISDIDTGDRKRPVDPAFAEVIAASIAEVGLKQPIVVRIHPNEDEEGCPYHYKLVIGAHRIYAVDRLLGWDALETGNQVLIEDMSDEEAELAEVDENLARAELNALDRAIFLADRKRLYLLAHPEGGRGKANKLKGKEKGQTLASYFSRSFAKATADRVGLSKSAINLAIQLAEKLDPETIAALRGTAVETNQRELLALAALDPFTQRQVAGNIREAQGKSVAKSLVSLGLSNLPPVTDPQTRFYATLLETWEKADKVTRANFLATAGLDYAKAAAPAKAPRK